MGITITNYRLNPILSLLFAHLNNKGIAMKRFFLICSIITLVSLLAGCGPIYKRNYEHIPPKSQTGKMCHAQCVQTKGACQEACRVDTERCQARAKQDALYEYEQYKHHQRKEGKPIEKDISEFNRGGSCGNSCNCEPMYNDCFKACGGKIIEHKTCVAFCENAVNT